VQVVWYTILCVQISFHTPFHIADVTRKNHLNSPQRPNPKHPHCSAQTYTQRPILLAKHLWVPLAHPPHIYIHTSQYCNKLTLHPQTDNTPTCINTKNTYKRIYTYTPVCTKNMPLRTHITAHQLDQDQDLLTELRILGSIRPQDRISTNHAVKPVVRIQKPEFFRSMFRFFGSESRASNMAYIQSLLQRVIDRYTTAVHNGDMALQARICDETESAIQGVRRLQQTYEDDAQFQASVNISVDTVCIHLGITLEEHDRPLAPIAQPCTAPQQPHSHNRPNATSLPVHIPPASSVSSSSFQSSSSPPPPKPAVDPFDYTHIPSATTSTSTDTDSDQTGSLGGGVGVDYNMSRRSVGQLSVTPDASKAPVSSPMQAMGMDRAACRGHANANATTNTNESSDDDGDDDDDDRSVVHSF